MGDALLEEYGNMECEYIFRFARNNDWDKYLRGKMRIADWLIKNDKINYNQRSGA